MSIADHYMTQMSSPTWSDLTLAKAVKEGYKANGWVYRSVRLISISGASVPWHVEKDGKTMPSHHLTKLLERPNPRISRQTMFELMISWLELCGNSYLIPVKVRGRTSELWPCSPDRLRPVASNDPVEWVKGYANATEDRIIYQPEEVIHFLFPDPANPIIGIGPLQAAAKAVDTDTEQQDWNKSAMQNRGVLDGIFTFKREFKRIEDLEELTEKLNEKFSGKQGKRLGAIGSEATYTRIAATPSEMDYSNGRKMNREEIFVIFGVPGPLAGVSDAMTYNNYAASELIFWMGTIVPLLDDLKDTLNFFFDGELQPGEEICYDLSNVPAIRKARFDQIKSAKLLSDMGVPMDKINQLLKLNVPKYDGWDQPVKQPTTSTAADVASTRSASIEIDSKDISPALEQAMTDILTNIQPRSKKKELRVSAEEMALQKEADTMRYADKLAVVLAAQSAAVEEALLNGGDFTAALESFKDNMYKAVENIYVKVAEKYSGEEIRSTAVQLAILAYLEQEAIILNETSLIMASTTAMIIEQVNDVLSQGLPVAAAAQAIADLGAFSPARAARIARTVVGAAASVGQLVSGIEAGATKKTWVTSGFEVRDTHAARSGETVGIDERFSAQIGSIGPRFPGDPDVDVADRVNCRCALTFS